MAIEIEKKFILSEKDRQRLIEGAETIGTKAFTDTYYDNDAYGLTSKDIWLRVRDGRWELKLPLEHFQTHVANQYRELETEREIAGHFGFPGEASLEEALRAAGYRPFVSIVTTRSKYRKAGFSIDLDVMDFGYEVAEIEKMVETEGGINEATEAIVDFARAHGLETDKEVRGKVIEYLARKDRKHLDALVAAGVVLPE